MTGACPALGSRWVRAAMVRGITSPATARIAVVASTGAAFTLLPFGRSGSVNALSGCGKPKRLPRGTERKVTIVQRAATFWPAGGTSCGHLNARSRSSGSPVDERCPFTDVWDARFPACATRRVRPR